MSLVKTQSSNRAYGVFNNVTRTFSRQRHKKMGGNQLRFCRGSVLRGLEGTTITLTDITLTPPRERERERERED